NAVELEKQVRAWRPRSRGAVRVIEIPERADIDLDRIARFLPMTLRAGITIASTRGALSTGGLLHLDVYPSKDTVVFLLTGDGARISNLRLRGPSSGVDGTACGRLYFQNKECPDLTAIQADPRYAGSISGSEIFDWPSTAIDVRGSDDGKTCARGPFR